MSKSPFTDLDYRLSVVRRWNLLKTVQSQSVAEHCFNVARIAANIWVPWFDGRTDQLADVYEWALHHDDEEALTLDIPTMVKPYFDEQAFRADHAEILGPWKPLNTDVKMCVKTADKMEGFYFLQMEAALGNYYAREHIEGEYKIIMDWANQHLPDKAGGNLDYWLSTTEVLRPRSVRYSKRGR